MEFKTRTILAILALTIGVVIGLTVPAKKVLDSDSE